MAWDMEGGPEVLWRKVRGHHSRLQKPHGKWRVVWSRGLQKQIWAGSWDTQNARLTAVVTSKQLWEDRKVSRKKSHTVGR